MWEWRECHAAGVQAMAAIGTLLLTLALAGVSYWYARLTRSSLAIAKRQFDRQWQPQLAVGLEYAPPFVANLVIHNISNCSVVITGVLIKAVEDGRQPTSYLVHHPVDSHTKGSINIANQLMDAIRSQTKA